MLGPWLLRTLTTQLGGPLLWAWGALCVRPAEAPELGPLSFTFP